MNKWKTLGRPIIGLSPMADLTDLPFSILVRYLSKELYQRSNLKPEICSDVQFFGPVIFREMVSANAVVMQNDKTMKMLEHSPIEFPVIQQVVGNDPAMISDAIKIILEKSKPFGIDINMGCPSKRINKNGSGAALLNNPKLAGEIVKKAKASCENTPLSVKTRTGWDSANGIVDFAKRLEDSGCDLISIHGRTRTQGYSGVADWNIIRIIKESVNIPVLGNGDITNADVGIERLKQSGCDGLLIGRGALGNPWIFTNIRCRLSDQCNEYELVDIRERIDTTLRHLSLHIDHYGEKGYITFKKHLVFYFKGVDIPNVKKIRVQLVSAKSADEIRSILNDLKNHSFSDS